MTTPVVNIYFIQRVSTYIFSVVNWVGIISIFAINWILKKQKNRDFLQDFFLLIVTLDVVGFIVVSIYGINHINFRFFGMAILNGTSTAIWGCIIRSNINRVWQGDNLTNYQTQENYLVSISEILGATLAIVVIKLDINIDILIGLQILGQLVMGIFDYKVIRSINKRQPICNKTQIAQSGR
jgi:hypothetical protein